MSRSGYVDDLDNWPMIKWRGQVASAIRRKRGQALLKDLVKALEALPDKALIAADLEDSGGSVCALGAVGKFRGMDMSKLDPEEPCDVAQAFNIAEPLAQEIAYENDEWSSNETPEQRCERMLKWARNKIL